MNAHRYILEPYKTPANRYRCPDCGKVREFTRYIDAETREPLADHVGKCNRELRCGYHYTPKQFFADNPDAASRDNWRAAPYRMPTMMRKPEPPRPVDFLPSDLVGQSHQGFERNNLFIFLAATIGEQAARRLFELYRVGTSKHWPGATAFWQIDTEGQARQCKIMLYNTETGRRVKQPHDHVYFAGKQLIGRDNPNLMQCPFGSHLLPLCPSAVVAFVESEKTAMYCAHIYPDLIWLATGGKHGAKWTDKAVIEPLRGRTVVMFPDLSATADWQAKAKRVAELIPCKIHVSTDLESRAAEADRAEGLDIMDFLIREGITEPMQPTPADHPEPPPCMDAIGNGPESPLNHVSLHGKDSEGGNGQSPEKPLLSVSLRANGYPSTWDDPAPGTASTEYLEPANKVPEPIQRDYATKWDLAGLRETFAAIQLPAGPIRLDGCATIINPIPFISSHLQTLEANNGNPTFDPFHARLIRLVEIVKQPSLINYGSTKRQ